MKYLKNICVAALLGTTGMLSSCNDWLGLDPENSVTAGQYWKSEADVSAAMTGIYIDVLNNSLYFLQQGEMRADFMTSSRTIYVPFKNVHEGNITSSNALVQWASYYDIINSCNLLLEYSDQALANDPSFTVNACNEYKAQAKVIRALMYFYLIRLYKDVPYITWAYYDDQTERSVPTTAQIDILNDLIAQMEALQLENTLPYSYSVNSVAQNKGQVTMYMLKALLADMYLWKAGFESADAAAAQTSYRKCVDLCEAIINSGQFALVSVPKTNAADAVGSYLEDAKVSTDSAFYVIDDNAAYDFFNQVYIKGNSTESIFELQMDDYSMDPGFYSRFVYSSRWYAPNDSHIADDMFIGSTNACAKNGNYEDVRYKICVGGSGEGKYCRKFAGLDLQGTIVESSSDYDRNVLIYRLPQIYLMEAEALNQIAWMNGEDQTTLLQAYKCVYKVRDRAAAVEATDVMLGNGQFMQSTFWNELRNDSTITLSGVKVLGCKEMEQFILDEEGREMMFEGKRWFDVLRTALRNNYGEGACKGGGLNYLTTLVLNATTVDKIVYLQNAYKNYESHYLPYPYQDVQLNDYLSQKPFYGVE